MDRIAFLCMKIPKELNAIKDAKLVVFACGYADLLTVRNQWNYDSIVSPYWRLYWNNKPGARIMFHQQQTRLTPSNLVLVAPHTPVSTYNQRHIHQLYVHFMIVTPHINKLHPNVYVIPATMDVKSLVQKTILELRKIKSAEWRFSLLTRALVELSLSYIVDRDLRLPVIDPPVQLGLQYLETHYNTNVSNDTLARQSGLSLSAFMHLFKKQMGYTPHNYLALKRTEKACALLYTTNTSIKQIAEDTGFCDRYHFSRVFKRCQGVSPAVFRRRTFNPA